MTSSDSHDLPQLSEPILAWIRERIANPLTALLGEAELLARDAEVLFMPRVAESALRIVELARRIAAALPERSASSPAPPDAPPDATSSPSDDT